MSLNLSEIYLSGLVNDFIRKTIIGQFASEFQEQSFKCYTDFSFLLQVEPSSQSNVTIRATLNEACVKLDLKIKEIECNAIIKKNCIDHHPKKENTISKLKYFNEFAKDENIIAEIAFANNFFEENAWEAGITDFLLNALNSYRSSYGKTSDASIVSFVKLDKNQLDSKNYAKINDMYYNLIESHKFREILDVDNIYLYDNDGKKEFYYRDQGDINLKEYLCETDEELIEVLEKYANQLEEMKDLGILFTKIPECSTKVVFTNSKDVSGSSNLTCAYGIKLLLGFFNIDNYTCSANAYNLTTCSTSFQSSKASLFIHLNSITKDSSLYFLTSSKLGLDQFAYKDIENQSRLLGKGGFGQVYHNIFNSQNVAIKLQISKNNSKSNNPIIEEYNLMLNLNHPTLLRPLGYIDYNNKFGIVLNQCSLNLGEFIKKKIERPKHQVKYDLWEYKGKMKMILAIAEGISYMHARKYGHFDIKPSNIFLSEDFEPKIADFGLSKLILGNEDMKTKGCSLFYSPYEQVSGQKISFSADVWAFGITMYVLIFEKHPFEDLKILVGSKSKELQKKMYIKHIYEKLHRPAIPIDYQKNHPLETSLMQMCWHSNPEKRPTMEKIVKKLANISATSIHI
ncbi:hypothetical protein SteCoe_20411 [Stentor coeruleus]|uniref:Protein kinase domain-containing protein n=1 Tax=Stentor coeruleus TaxID=5963 RepID=A0A1R2BSC2_9CILI|nr:hypothetical protein SteCoe_20411 [Stentor coeruleus]